MTGNYLMNLAGNVHGFLSHGTLKSAVSPE